MRPNITAKLATRPTKDGRPCREQTGYKPIHRAHLSTCILLLQEITIVLPAGYMSMHVAASYKSLAYCFFIKNRLHGMLSEANVPGDSGRTVMLIRKETGLAGTNLLLVS